MPSIKPVSKPAARRQRTSGKTYQVSLATEAMPSDVSWAHWPAKAVRSNRQGAGGRTQVVCLDPAVALRGGCSTPNISASPNAGVESFLWQVVERISIPPRYFLSPTACSGILRRAAHRGKTLPPLLHLALLSQSTMPT